MIDPNKIDLSKIATELRRYEHQWVAISEDTRIVASGKTYGETAAKVPASEDVVLLKVPPLDYSFAPSGA